MKVVIETPPEKETVSLMLTPTEFKTLAAFLGALRWEYLRQAVNDSHTKIAESVAKRLQNDIYKEALESGFLERD